MKLFVTIVCALLALANASVPFEEVRHIDELLLQSPDKYPFITAMYQIYGKSSYGRIVGGEVATRGQFPYQCAMYISASGGTFFCGCSIISSRTILTAAHCVDQAKSVQVILAAQNINQNEPEQVKYTVSTSAIRVHENWNSQLISNDIALITLPSDIQFNQYIQRVSLPKKSDKDKEFLNEACTTSGWGKSSDGKLNKSTAFRGHVRLYNFFVRPKYNYLCHGRQMIFKIFIFKSNQLIIFSTKYKFPLFFFSIFWYF